MEVPKIKSVGFLSIRKYIFEKFGEDVYATIIEQLDDDTRQIVESLMTASQWYPEEACRHFFLAAEKVLAVYGRPEALFYEMGRFLATADIPNFYKPLIRLLDINFTLKVTIRLWRLYHTHGELRIEPVDKNSTYIHIVDYPTPYKPFCWSMAGYFHGVAELAGFQLTKPIEELECILEGNGRCTFFAAWQ